MKAFVCSSPGKIILFGEHAVVYGKNAIAASIDLRTYGLMKPYGKGITLNCPDIKLFLEMDNIPWKQFQEFKKELNLDDIVDEYFKDLNSFVKKVENLKLDLSIIESKLQPLLNNQYDSSKRSAALCFYTLLIMLFEEQELRNIDFELTIQSKIPVGAGLGSSASFAVTLSACLIKLKYPKVFKQVDNNNKILINKLGFLMETIIHGNPSGVDNTVSTFGGLVKFRKGKFELVEGLNSMNVMITNTKVSRNTKVQVANVRSLYDKMPKVIVPIMDSIDGISDTLIDLLSQKIDEDTLFKEVSTLITTNQKLLELIQVSHASLENVINIHKKYNISCKLTGAGGGGCALSLLPKKFDVKQLKFNLQSNSYDSYNTMMGGNGVMLHDVKELSSPELDWFHSKL